MKYIPFVNIKQGSASVHRFSHGNTLPFTQLPFAMNAFAPQTKSDSSWFFHPSDRCLEGVRLTHQPSPWIADYGSPIFMPQKHKPAFGAGQRWSGYRPQEAVLQPHYLKLRFLRSRCDFELVPTVRGCYLRVHFDDPEENYFSVLPLYGESEYEYKSETNTLYVCVANCRDENAVNFRMYTVIRFGEWQIAADGNIAGTDEKHGFCNRICADGAGMHLKVIGRDVEARAATSYISFEQAERNLL